MLVFAQIAGCLVKAQCPQGVSCVRMKHFIKESAFVLAHEEQPSMSLPQVMLEKTQGKRERLGSQDPPTIAAISLRL